jgi:hypothetical protein
MNEQALYVYAIGRGLGAPDQAMPEAVDGSSQFASTEQGQLSAIFTLVPHDSFAQEAIDAHAADLQWLGSIGLRHQAVINHLASISTIIPLRAFTLFTSERSLRDYLAVEGPTLGAILDRLEGKEEWTFRIELDAEKWGDESAARDLVDEIEMLLVQATSAPTIVETPQLRSGSFPQITLLLPKLSEGLVTKLSQELGARYVEDGVTLAVTGPWPPYTFATEAPID